MTEHNPIITELENDKFHVTILTIPMFPGSDKNWETTGAERAIARRVKNIIHDFEADEKWANFKTWYKTATKKTCSRCKGEGGLDQYLHVAQGVCFKCGGSGKVLAEKYNG